MVGRATEPVRSAFRREAGLFNRRRYSQAIGVLTDLFVRPDLTPRQRFEALCRKAECLESLRRPRAAVELLRDVARSYPGESAGFSLLGEYLYRVHEDMPAALKALRRALRLAPRDPDSLWWYGQILQFGLADFKKARRFYQAALEACPRYAAAQESLAQLCEAEGKWVEAIDWRKAHYRCAHPASDLVSLAELYLRLGNAKAARKYAQSAVRREPGSAAAWLACAKALASLGKHARAAESLKRFMRLASPKTGPFVATRDLAFLEPIASRPQVQRLLTRLPVQ